jgi:hypothetical protein
MLVLDPAQFRAEVVRRALQALDPAVPYSLSAENLILGTALQESRLHFLRQLGSGPARGLFQMEPATHDDLRNWVRQAKPAINGRLEMLTSAAPAALEQLMTNLLYAAAMCRIKYYRSPHSLPAADDIDGLGRFWKSVYNTPLGAGTSEEFAAAYRQYCLT